DRRQSPHGDGVRRPPAPGPAVNEAGRVAMLSRILAASAGGIATGIGDDAAVLEVAGAAAERGRLVWTIDEQVDGSHFRRDLASWRAVGWALSSLVVPDDVDDAALEELARGQRAAAETLGAPVVGGNLARGPALSVATTLLGTCETPVLRRGARPGDGLWLAGRVGLAAAGLRALEARKGGEAPLSVAIDAWRTPRALVAEGRAMRPVAHAAVDVSDGLARDVGHIAEASGVRVVLDAGALLSDGVLASVALALAAEALELALYGGEDYAIVAASPVPIAGFRRIGDVTAGQGVALRGSNGEDPIEPRGFDHFTSGKPRAASRS